MLSHTVIQVSSLDHPDLQPFRTLRRPQEHIRSGVFVAEGEKVVVRLLNSRLEIISFLLSHEWYTILVEREERFRECAAKVFVTEKRVLERIVGYRLHQGIMAVAKVPAEPALEELLGKLKRPFLIVGLDGLMNSENVGVLVRNCAAFGVDMILVGETSSSPYLRRAVRNSMGTVFEVPVLHEASLASRLEVLRGDGVTIIAAHARGDHSIEEADLRGNSCIVFGNEETGISQAVLSACSIQVAIPMHRQTDSLNVSSAAAVFLYEADRQRRRGTV
jgi:tRNA G18 (ribose-2'-O)-methylase SpoU